MKRAALSVPPQDAKEMIDKDKDVAINVSDNIKDGKSGGSREVL